jgi:uncharacterized protein (TIGR00730 family)
MELKRPTSELLAFNNPDFIHSREARPIRILSEYSDPETRFRKNGITHTVVFFGSARIKKDGAHAISAYYDYAEELAFRVASWSATISDPHDRVYICTGGGPGIMEAANRGADRAGQKSIGLNIQLPFEQKPNPYISPELNMEFHYFYMRKLWFLYQAKALVAFPGGFGTFDELFESLTLLQTQKIEKSALPVVLFGSEFWKKVVNFDMLVETGVISPEDMSLFRFCDSVDECYEYLIPRIEAITRDVNTIL